MPWASGKEVRVGELAVGKMNEGPSAGEGRQVRRLLTMRLRAGCWWHGCLADCGRTERPAQERAGRCGLRAWCRASPEGI